ncbi:hypothetical protein [Polyangium spumosum]|uniref:Uncharacterized protein n=1 Tax=Polyangium spumosum TaxID=889282 RepID=A0A6N7PQS2_9BACT|nr:hypothetical protein [Polyangium spumosum]MRG94279.1 hypothetical protein [Polyangium spumosum]
MSGAAACWPLDEEASAMGPTGGADGGEERVVLKVDTATAPTAPAPAPAPSPRSRLWTYVAVVGGLIVAAPFVVASLHQRSVAEQKCAGARKTVENRIAREDFEEIERFVAEAERVCGSEHEEEIRKLQREISEKRGPAEERQAREAQERRAAAAKEAVAEAEANERAAVKLFPERAKHIDEWLADAEKAIAQGRREDALTAVVRSEQVLDGFKGTSVERSPRWREIERRMAALRKRLGVKGDSASAAYEEGIAKEVLRQLQEDRGGR